MSSELTTAIVLSNQEFLKAIFKDRFDQGEFAWICSFNEDPKHGSWAGHSWDGQTDLGTSSIHHPENCYFCLSSFKSPREGRKTTNISACIGVILDDLGTKANPVENLPIPTWAIETSPGNFQYGYVFSPVITDLYLAKNFFKKLGMKQDLTDTGGQNVTRYARLPNGYNTKGDYVQADGSSPATRLVLWNPDVRYTPDELAKALGLNHAEQKIKKAVAESEADVFEDALAENPVVTQLKSFGLYKFEKAIRTHEITCPWVHEHSGGTDNGTVYFEPTEEHRFGGFKCHHGHCSHRRIRDLCQHLGVEIDSASNRPAIKVLGGELHRIVAKCEELLHRAGYYQNGGIIVSVQSHKTSQGEVVSTVALDATMAAVELTRIAAWLRYDGRQVGWVNIDAPAKYAAAIVTPTQRHHLRPIVALSRQPFLRPDGTVCDVAGYDSDSQIYASFDPNEFPAIPEYPTREDAESAAKILLELIQETPFKRAEDQSAALALFLTATIRPVLPTAPGFLINAHSSGSGKSYLQDLAGAFATPEIHLPSAAFIPNDEELRKELISKLLEAPAVIKWDEMQTDLLPMKALLSALTSERIERRKLGVTQLLKVSTRSLMLFAGNNVQPVNDMTRRVITIHIDPQMEDPATRNFKGDSLGDLRKDRGRYIMAAFTIIRAWQAAGKPYAEGVKATVNGYGLWSDFCRQPLLWLGLPDPAANLFDALKSDPAKEELARLMEGWHDAFGSSTISVKEIIAKACMYPELNEALLEIAEGKSDEIDPKKLGRYLKKSLGRPINDRVLQLDNRSTRSSNSYRLVSLSATRAKRGAWKNEEILLTNPGKESMRSYSSYCSYSANSGINIITDEATVKSSCDLGHVSVGFEMLTANTRSESFASPSFER